MRTRHSFGLAGMIAVGTLLRFWHLESKPLWLDEVITAIFALGRDRNDIPLEVVWPLSALESIFSLDPAASCTAIAQTVAAQSTHPPLFFCLLHNWLVWLRPDFESLIWVLRALPALLGAGTILALYNLNRVAFSPTSGLLGASVMAVSPLAVYLSQEARHYTLPLLLIALALTGLIGIGRDLLGNPRLRPRIWLGWIAVNSLSLYVHYFCLLAFLAQGVTLLALLLGHSKRLSAQRRPWQVWGIVSLTLSAVLLSYLPWLPTFLNHLESPETNWLALSNPLAPIYHTLLAWVLMVIALPVENQPLWVAIPSGLLMLGWAGWLFRRVTVGLRKLWSAPRNQHAVVTLVGFTTVVILEYWAIAFVFDKDLTAIPRYHFVYYPSFCALLGAGVASLHPQTLETKVFGQRQQQVGRGTWLPTAALCLLVATLSSLLVIFGFVFKKPFYPRQVALNLSFEPAQPVLIAVGYRDLQDIALGLSFALAMHQHNPGNGRGTINTSLVFLERSQGYESVWSHLAQLEQLDGPAARSGSESLALSPPLNLWVIAPGLRRRDYPQELAVQAASRPTIPGATRCQLDPTYHYRIGVPYQLYRCLDCSNFHDSTSQAQG